MVLALLSVTCLSVSPYSSSRSSPSIYSDTAELPRGRVTSLLQQLGSSSSGGVLPTTVWRSRQAKAQRRAMTLGSRLEPPAGAQLSPGVKAMRYGRRSHVWMA